MSAVFLILGLIMLLSGAIGPGIAFIIVALLASK